jgi:hypothetical protein
VKNVFLIAVVQFFCSLFIIFPDSNFSTFMPPNDLYVPTGLRSAEGISENEFHFILDRFEDIYAPMVENQGGTLNLIRNWKSGEVNANTSRSGSSWNIEVYGGIARHGLVNADAFTLIMCHEFGHNFGGNPKMGRIFYNWVSVEGQADYYASVKCFEMFTSGEDSSLIVQDMEIHPVVEHDCNEVYEDFNDKALCKRIAMAGFNVGLLLQEAFSDNNSDPFSGYSFWKKEKKVKPVSFDTPDNDEVWMTKKTHPTPQCRVDTFFAGALCDKILSHKPVDSGYCKKIEGYTKGVRPRCWFKP